MTCAYFSNPTATPDNAGDAASAPNLAASICREVAIPFLITRGILVLIGCLGAWHFAGALPNGPQLLQCFSRFDGLWYVQIARDGYTFDQARQSSIAFSPLLPILMRWVGWALGSSDSALRAAGLIISNLSLLIALVLTRQIAAELYGERIARRAVGYVLICPGTLFLSAVYPMSLMMALGAGAIYAARNRRWELASAIGMLAPLARPDGVLLLIPLLYQASKSRRLERQHLWLVMIPAMLAIWLSAQWLAFGTPLAFVHAQKAWASSPLALVAHSSRAPLILGLGAFFVLLTAFGWFELPAAFSLYSTIYLALMLNAGRFWSLPRFLVILFPCFITLAWVSARWKWLHVFYVVIATLLAAIFTLRFTLDLWVA